MTIEEFEAKLKALFDEAEKAGLDMEEALAIAEHIVGYGWKNKKEDNDA